LSSDEPKGTIRCWDVPAFAEQPTITAPQVHRYEAISVSPDGGTLAVAEIDRRADKESRLIRLFDLATGEERASSQAELRFNSPCRLGFTPDGRAVGAFDKSTVVIPHDLGKFTPDGKAVGVINIGRLAWRDTVTGRPANPALARFAVPPAAMSNALRAVSTDGRWLAEGYDRHRDFGDIGGLVDGRENEFGGFILVTERATGTIWAWRVGKGNAPDLAFSPDGKKLAGTASQMNGGSIVIWAVPKERSALKNRGLPRG
jgi:WD40 repeat protein